MISRVTFFIFAIGSAVTGTAAEPDAEAVPYRCLFNHELLIISGKKVNSPDYIQSFVSKLAGTDVDAVMCCPTMWRTNLFPSDVDPTWKQYRPDQPLSKFHSWDYIMRYLHAGGDPVKDTLAACRKSGKAFFISYRMNDHHYVTDLDWPSHNAIWRQHPEYWLGDSDTSPYSKQDNVRLFNYLLSPVREFYFAILQELCTYYDVDGVELDFQRFPKFFPSDKLPEGTLVMTAFVTRIKDMLDRIGRERNKFVRLCIRVPETLAKCREAGLDIPTWDASGLVDMINISSFYNHTLELDIEGFRAHTRRAKLYGEMNYVTYQAPKKKSARRYTSIETYRASALNLLSRGADGLSLFNYDYVPEKLRLPMTDGLKRITDLDFLKSQSKNYVVSRGFGPLPATNEVTLTVVIPDNTSEIRFSHALLRVEARRDCSQQQLTAELNGQPLAPAAHPAQELFPPLTTNDAYPNSDTLKFFAVPLDILTPGRNQVAIRNVDKKQGSCQFVSLEIALYR